MSYILLEKIPERQYLFMCISILNNTTNSPAGSFLSKSLLMTSVTLLSRSVQYVIFGTKLFKYIDLFIYFIHSCTCKSSCSAWNGFQHLSSITWHSQNRAWAVFRITAASFQLWNIKQNCFVNQQSGSTCVWEMETVWNMSVVKTSLKINKKKLKQTPQCLTYLRPFDHAISARRCMSSPSILSR